MRAVKDGLPTPSGENKESERPRSGSTEPMWVFSIPFIVCVPLLLEGRLGGLPLPVSAPSLLASQGQPGRSSNARDILTRPTPIAPRCALVPSEHILIVRVPRAGGRPGCPSPLLTLCSSTDYSLAMELPDLKDDAYLKVLRPLVEAYLAFALIDNRHIKSLRLTPSQFDVIATLGDTDGLTCSELSARTLVTKGTLTGVLDRLAAKELIRRDAVAGDRRCIKIRLTQKGDKMFRETFTAHIAFLKPFFKRALSQKDIDVACGLLLRLRDSFRKEAETYAKVETVT